MMNYSAQRPSKPTEYANLLSRILLKSRFERQFVIPLEPPPKLIEALLTWYERHMLKIDTSTIQIDRPIFLVGMPRSGTSMLEEIICSHPHVAFFTNTMHQYRRCFCAAEMMRKYLRLDCRGERYIYDGVEVSLGSPSEGHMFLADWRKVDPFSTEYTEYHPVDMTPQERDRVHETLRKVIWCFGGQAHRFFNKSPNMIVYMPHITQMLPDAKIIHLVRDGRMVANSMIKLYHRHRDQERKIRALLGKTTDSSHNFFVPYPRLPKLAEYLRLYGADDIRTTANTWNDAMISIAQWQEHLPNFYEVRYEDIVSNPRREIQALCEFCELEPIADPQTPFWQKVGRIRPMRHYPEYRDFDIVEAVCRDPLQRYGYLS